MRDMEFNQVLLCMSRALGAVASMIWAKAMDSPVEHPMSKSTHSYLNILKSDCRKLKK